MSRLRDNDEKRILIVTDEEILEYAHNHHCCVTMEDLQRDIISTSPQIKGVYRDVWYGHITLITPNHQILFFEK